MKSLMLVVAALLADERRSIEPTILPPTTDALHYAIALQDLHSVRNALVGPNVSREASDFVFVFPIAGNAAGGGGTFFRSEAMIVNNLNRPQDVFVFFFAASNTLGCSGGQTRRIRMEARSFYVYSDVVAQVFGINGLGSVIFGASDAAGNPDTTARIDGVLRIWTPIPGGNFGSASQSFISSALNVSANNQIAYGLRQDNGFRTNVGIFNYLPSNETTRLFDVYVGGVNGASAAMTINVPPCTAVLQAIPAGNFSSLLIQITSRDAIAGWYAFGSSVDNISGDNWSVTARPQ